MTGAKSIVIDNIERPVRSELLCTYSTQKNYESRILGKSQMVKFETSGLIICTGNNLVFQGDLIRRSLMCTLWTNLERPDQRKFKFLPEEFCMKNRIILVKAALTILKAYMNAGRPIQNISGFGSFENWSSVVRSAIVWLGKADPNEAADTIRAADPELELLNSIVTNWAKVFGTKIIRISEISEFAQNCTENKNEDYVELLNSIQSISHGKDRNTAFGKYLGKNVGRVVNDLKIVKHKIINGTTRWSVERIQN